MPDASALREALARYGRVVVTPVGSSMWPLLRNHRDQAVLEPVSEPLRRLDVALFVRGDGTAVLHRAVTVAADAYVFQGDGQTEREPGVRPDQVLAVMTGYYRGKRLRSVTSRRYRAYRALWCGPLGRLLRGPALRMDRLIYRARRHFRHKGRGTNAPASQNSESAE